MQPKHTRVQHKDSQVFGWSQARCMSVSQRWSSCLLVLVLCVCMCVDESLLGFFGAQPTVYPGHHSHFTQGQGVGQVLLKLCQSVCVCSLVCMFAPGSEEISSLPWHVLSSCLFPSWQTLFWLPVIFFFFFFTQAFCKADLIRCNVRCSTSAALCEMPFKSHDRSKTNTMQANHNMGDLKPSGSGFPPCRNDLWHFHCGHSLQSDVDAVFYSNADPEQCCAAASMPLQPVPHCFLLQLPRVLTVHQEVDKICQVPEYLQKRFIMREHL